MTDQPLVLRQRDARGVVTLTLNRPDAFNALSESLLDALQTELHAVADDPTARVVVIGAAGKAFCAGHDLKEMRAEPSLGYYERLFAHCARMMLAIQKLPVPVIARVQGTATAAGCQLVAMCDLAVAVQEARFAVSGVNLGLFCSTPLTAKRASCTATARSHIATSWQPAAVAVPWTRAITGTGSFWIASIMRAQCANSFS